MRIFIYILLLSIAATRNLSLDELKHLRAQLENHPILKASKHHKKNDRKLFTENEFQTGSSYVQQMQDTNTNLNEMMGHSKRQQEMKTVGQWFADVEEKLDDFVVRFYKNFNQIKFQSSTKTKIFKVLI